jgi:MarR family transcriptional repressor of emrRAB
MHTPDDRLVNLLGALATGLGDRIAAATEETAGESATTVAALTNVAQFPGSSIEELRHSLGLSHSATVRAVDRLAARRLIARRPGARGPAVALVPTASGRRLATRVLDVRRRVVADVVGDSLPRELEPALDILLARMTVDPHTGDRICRLCDLAACPVERCPVVERQRAQGVPPPPGVVLRTLDGD